jgi:hypothetical protein
MTNKIDHFAIGAATLEQGEAALQSLLGANIPRGGKHDLMSTHNCVAQAGNNSFLEILAIDPSAPTPSRTRWFTLDDAKTTQKLAQSPRALCWVVGCEDLDAIVANSPVDLGEIVTFTRGDRSWRLTVPKDGSLPENGLIPAFIEWSPGPHPSSGMQDLDLKLDRIVLRHPEPSKIKGYLEQLNVAHLADVEESAKPELVFCIETANGSKVEVN